MIFAPKEQDNRSGHKPRVKLWRMMSPVGAALFGLPEIDSQLVSWLKRRNPKHECSPYIGAGERTRGVPRR